MTENPYAPQQQTSSINPYLSGALNFMLKTNPATMLYTNMPTISKAIETAPFTQAYRHARKGGEEALSRGDFYMGGAVPGYIHGWNAPVNKDYMSVEDAPGGRAVELLEPVQTILGALTGGLGKAGQTPIHLSKLPGALLGKLPARWNPVNRYRANLVENMLRRSSTSGSMAAERAGNPSVVDNFLNEIDLKDYFFPRKIDPTAAEPITVVAHTPDAMANLGTAYYRAHGMEGAGAPSQGYHFALGEGNAAKADVVGYELSNMLKPRGAKTIGHEADHTVLSRLHRDRGFWKQAPESWADDHAAFAYNMKQAGASPEAIAAAESNMPEYVGATLDKYGRRIKSGLSAFGKDPKINPGYHRMKEPLLNEERLVNTRWGNIPNTRVKDTPFTKALHETARPYRKTGLDIRSDYIRKVRAIQQAKKLAAVAAKRNLMPGEQ
jgi:hypothetical protein